MWNYTSKTSIVVIFYSTQQIIWACVMPFILQWHLLEWNHSVDLKILVQLESASEIEEFQNVCKTFHLVSSIVACRAFPPASHRSSRDFVIVADFLCLHQVANQTAKSQKQQ